MQQVREIYERIFLVACHVITVLRLRLTKGASIGASVRFKGGPIVDLRNGGILRVGADTTVNSRNFGYHINMFAPCKFYCDKPNAIIEIGKGCRIHGTAIHAQKRVSIGDQCLIAANTQIMDCNAHDLALNNPQERTSTLGTAKEIEIGDCVWIGSGVTILPGVTIGYGAVIASGTVVTKDVPPRSVFGGSPGKVLRQE